MRRERRYRLHGCSNDTITVLSHFRSSATPPLRALASLYCQYTQRTFAKTIRGGRPGGMRTSAARGTYTHETSRTRLVWKHILHARTTKQKVDRPDGGEAGTHLWAQSTLREKQNAGLYFCTLSVAGARGCMRNIFVRHHSRASSTFEQCAAPLRTKHTLTR